MKRRSFLGALAATSLGVATSDGLSIILRARKTVHKLRQILLSSNTSEFPQNST